MKNASLSRPSTPCLTDSLFRMIEERLLVTVENGTAGSNPMTVSWGCFGVLFGERVLLLALRPSRYTATLLQKTDRLTVSRLQATPVCKDALSLCGQYSGRDTDKWSKTALHPVQTEHYHFPAEAETVFCCRILCKLPLEYEQLLPENRQELTKKFYASGDLHELYLCRIERILQPALSTGQP